MIQPKLKFLSEGFNDIDLSHAKDEGGKEKIDYSRIQSKNFKFLNLNIKSTSYCG